MTDYAGHLCQSFFSSYATNNLIDNCSLLSNTNTSGWGWYGGGLVGSNAGYNNGSITIQNCSNTGATSTSGSHSFGGIVGSEAGSSGGSVTIQNCTNSATVTGNTAGGIAGSNAGSSGGSVTVTNCSNSGTISGSYAGGVVGTQAGQQGSATITNCTNSGAIAGSGAGGIVGRRFGYDTNKTCSIINCYNVGNIFGANTGGICGSSVGFSDNVYYKATINITNCYSTGTIASSCGGLLGGFSDGSYLTTPIVTISNCYSSGVIAAGGDGLIAPSLQIKDSIINSQCYIANGSWSDSEANEKLLNYPTDVYTQGSVWTKLAGKNIPYVLSFFNSDIYSAPVVNSDTIIELPYSSIPGLFNNSGFKYKINSLIINDNNNLYSSKYFNKEAENITIDESLGVITFDKLILFGKYVVNVFVAKYNSNGVPYSYNYNKFTISSLSCFNHDTKILCLNKSLEEEYIPIQDLRKGHFVKTYLHGYRKIQCIGKGDMINDPTNWKNCMFKMEKNEENALIEDLVITGWHSILVDKLDKQEEKIQKKLFKTIYAIDDKQLLLAGVSSKFKPMDNEDKYTFYNFVLEDDDDENKRFGVYANGLLVEIPSKNMFLSKHYDEM